MNAPIPQKNRKPLTAAQKKKVADQVTKAVAAIVLDDPFYGYFLLRQEIKQTDTIPTAATNGIDIAYNPEFLHEMPLSKIKGLLRHEVMHIANLHHLRMQNRDDKKWNMACDYVVNAIGMEAGWDFPDKGLFNATYKDYSAEHVYNILPDPPPSGGGGGDGDGDAWNFGGVGQHPGATSEAARQQLEQDTIVEVIAAAEAAKMQGKLPAHIERLVDQIKQCKLPWKDILARFFKATAKNDYSWMRPNKRYLEQGFYLPSLYSTHCGPVALAIDTSGSIGKEELENFIAELNGILKFAKPSEVKVIYCDAEVQSVETFGPHDDVRATKPKGGGGTRFEPVFEWVEENMRECEVVIYLTDMYGSFPEKFNKCPTVWVSTTNIDKAPFGKVVHL